MSIPPLVCNTPPPPDQCDDDKDSEELETPYDLSQDDENDTMQYEFNNYYTYNHYQVANTKNGCDSKISAPFPLHPDDLPPVPIVNEKINENENGFCPIIAVSAKRLDDDSNIEDLDLQIEEQISKGSEINKEINHNIVETNSTVVTDGNESSTCKDITPIKVNLTKNDEKDLNSVSNSNVIKTDTEPLKSIIVLTNEETVSLGVEDFGEVAITDGPLSKIDNTINKNNIEETQEAVEPFLHVAELNLKTKGMENIGNLKDDFDDFQFSTDIENNVSVVTEKESPWSNESIVADSSEFQAKFDDLDTEEFKTDNCDQSTPETTEHIHSNDDIDDFGDFDDFKSVSENSSVVTPETNELPMLNLESLSSESQILEGIENVLNSVFENKIPHSETFSIILDDFLCETWGHLKQIEERQPYMITWNNSLAQKTLLKALCIDSRNILFVSKWNSSAPRYVANLDLVPLQPQKQTVTSTADNISQEKTSKRVADNWVDPFNSDTQESPKDSKEHTSNRNTADPDPGGFQQSTKLGKIYPSTLSIQPLRQINLPDTHIYTPTDSEIPRSKTIHYDTMPRTLPELNTEFTFPSGPISDNDYSDFQDFRNVDDNSSEPNKTNANQHTANVLFHTQSILQPIKVDPVMPKLNWPDPGEVKETFDDFTDFVSNTSWSSAEINTKLQTETVLNIAHESSFEIKKSNELDDDFDTFQSAIPISQCNLKNQNSLETDTGNANINSPILNDSRIKEDIQEKEIGRNENGEHSVHNEEKKEVTVHWHKDLMSPIEPTKLKSVQESSNKSNTFQKSQQILQPLSLESYSQINWPNPGIDLQDLSRFNPLDAVHTIQMDVVINGSSKTGSPAHSQKSQDDDWGDFVSIKPKQNQTPKKQTFVDEVEWSEFVSSPVVKPQNGLNTISLNVHTNLSAQKTIHKTKQEKRHLAIPTLNYVIPKSNEQRAYNDNHFQNL